LPRTTLLLYPPLSRSLILPLGRPAIASLAIFQFLWTWNDLLVALTFARETQPITVAIFSQLRSFSANIQVIATVIGCVSRAKVRSEEHTSELQSRLDI